MESKQTNEERPSLTGHPKPDIEAGGSAAGGYSGMSSGSERSPAAGTAARRAQVEGADVVRTVKEISDRATTAVGTAYEKTADAMGDTVDKVMTYGRRNPGKLTLIAFGAGLGVGVLIAASSPRSRTSRIVEPVVGALSEIALELFR